MCEVYCCKKVGVGNASFRTTSRRHCGVSASVVFYARASVWPAHWHCSRSLEILLRRLAMVLLIIIMAIYMSQSDIYRPESADYA